MGQGVKGVFNTIQPLINGDNLINIINNPNSLKQYDFLQTLEISIKLLLATKKLLEKKYIHGDMSSKNIMWDHNNRKCTLIDFGCTKKMNANNEAYDELGGTISYMAPELFLNIKNSLCKYNEKTEIYALGVILAELFSLKSIAPNVQRLILNFSAYKNKNGASSILKEAAPFIFSPSKLQHKNVHSVFQCITNMIIMQPQNRQSLDKILIKLASISFSLQNNPKSLKDINSKFMIERNEGHQKKLYFSQNDTSNSSENNNDESDFLMSEEECAKNIALTPAFKTSQNIISKQEPHEKCLKNRSKSLPFGI